MTDQTAQTDFESSLYAHALCWIPAHIFGQTLRSWNIQIYHYIHLKVCSTTRVFGVLSSAFSLNGSTDQNSCKRSQRRLLVI